MNRRAASGDAEASAFAEHILDLISYTFGAVGLASLWRMQPDLIEELHELEQAAFDRGYQAARWEEGKRRSKEGNQRMADMLSACLRAGDDDMSPIETAALMGAVVAGNDVDEVAAAITDHRETA